MAVQPETVRRPRRGLTVAAVIAALVVCLVAGVAATVLLFLPARGETDGPAPSPVDTPEPSLEPTSTPPGITEESALVADALRDANAEWADHITGIELVTVLHRPVILITSDIGAEQADLSDQVSADIAAFASGLSAGNGAPCTFYVQVLSAEGEIIGSIAATDERWVLNAPAPPADAAGLAVWIDETFGTGSPSAESWASRIVSIGGPAGDADGFVVLRTDLDPSVPADLRSAQIMIDAVNASGATFAPGVRVVFGDGAYEWSALVDGVDPYGP